MGLFRTILDVRRGERTKTALMFLYFFIIIASYWFLKPVRSALTVEKLGADSIRELKVIAALVSAAVVMLYSVVVSRLSRGKLAYLIMGTFAWLLLFFSIVFRYFGSMKLLYYSFYVFLDLFITVNVALFWTFLADISSTDSAKRLYGLIGAGGVLGGFVGSFTCKKLVASIGPSSMMLGVLGVYSLLFFIIWGISRRLALAGDKDQGPVASPGESRLHEAIEGARQVFSSRYFLGICVLLATYEFISTVNDFTFHKAVELTFKAQGGSISLLASLTMWLDQVTGVDVTGTLATWFGIRLGEGPLGSFFAEFYLLLNLVAVFIQLVVTPLVIRRIGLTAALMLLPLVLLGVSMGFLFVPFLALAEILMLSDNAFNYSINQTSREMLFVPVPRRDKYKTLAFIDMFVLRSAKALAGFSLVLLPVFYKVETIRDLRWYMILTLTLIVGWLFIATYLGRAFHKRTGEDPKHEAAH